MGFYLNPDNENFQESLNSEIYVDKSGLISFTNSKIKTQQKNICVSRPRRFGKSMAADMLCAYYSRGCDSREMFRGLKISQDVSFEQHLNKYNVIHIDMQDFLSDTDTMTDLIDLITSRLSREIKMAHKDIEFYEPGLVSILKQVYEVTEIPFIFIIDEWDCIFRVHKNDVASQKQYLDYLRSLLKGKSYVALAYMTGILPIKKYGEHSTLNMFYEYSMTGASPIQEYTGFTEDEVKELCIKYNRSFEEFKTWYDGYNMDGISIYNPKSVVEALLRGKIGDYWTRTESYEALKIYIQSNMYGIQDIIATLIACESRKIKTTGFANDMVTFNTSDDILTLLVHLGYLTYDTSTQSVSIPNKEVRGQFLDTIESMGWNDVITALNNSEELLKATFACDEERVAELIDAAHQENTSILNYNNENALSCVISLAYYSAKKSYEVNREMQAGSGFADMVFIPKNGVSTPAMVVELKFDKSAETALNQIKEKKYADCLKNYNGEILLVGINYDKNSKKHTCRIEKIKKKIIK